MEVAQAGEKDKVGILRLYKQFNQDRIKSGIGDSDFKFLKSEMPWAATLDDDECTTFIIREKSIILGFITIRLSSFNPFPKVDKLSEVDLIVVDRKLRRKSLGSILLKKAISHLKTYAVSHLLLNVRVGNNAAMEFWMSHGFKKLSSTQFEREDGQSEQTVYMIKKL